MVATETPKDIRNWVFRRPTTAVVELSSAYLMAWVPPGTFMVKESWDSMQIALHNEANMHEQKHLENLLRRWW